MDLAPVPPPPRPRPPGRRAPSHRASSHRAMDPLQRVVVRGTPALRALGRVTAGALLALSPQGGQGTSRRNALDALVTPRPSAAYYFPVVAPAAGAGVRVVP